MATKNSYLKRSFWQAYIFLPLRFSSVEARETFLQRSATDSHFFVDVTLLTTGKVWWIQLWMLWMFCCADQRNRK